jgi:hypothetical protein
LKEIQNTFWKNKGFGIRKIQELLWVAGEIGEKVQRIETPEELSEMLIATRTKSDIELARIKSDIQLVAIRKILEAQRERENAEINVEKSEAIVATREEEKKSIQRALNAVHEARLANTSKAIEKLKAELVIPKGAPAIPPKGVENRENMIEVLDRTVEEFKLKTSLPQVSMDTK